MRLSTLESKILNNIQSDFPIVPQPFKILSDRLGIEEETLIQILKRLKDKGIIRNFAIGLNHKKLGFRSSLVGLKVSSNMVESVAKEIIRYPEVTHCFLRAGDYNLWSVFIYSKKERFRQFLDKFAKRAGRENVLNLPTKKKFKLSTRLKI
jgi:DNA-binding Lrp family transcriptional regulator